MCIHIIDKVENSCVEPVSISAGSGFVKQKEKFGRDISGEQYKKYIKLNIDDFAYNKGNSKKFPQGAIYRLKEFSTAAVPSCFICFKFKNIYNNIFFENLFSINFHGHQLKNFITSSARSDGLLNISTEDFFNIYLPAPSLPEQQKIANCLSSLDELIEAHEQKLDALKQHKKGLMQRLFPAEGETTPRWRFPEFRNAGKWTIKKLGAIANNLDHKRIPISANKRAKGNIPYYGASGIVDYINDFIFNQNLLCISEDGANLISRVTPIAFSISGKSWVNNHAHVLEFNTFACQKFIENYINSINIEEFLTGMAQPKLNKSKLDSIPIPLPNSSVEQQKITDFFTSIDERIKAQEEKIVALKEHKKGLMQQLFPSL